MTLDSVADAAGGNVPGPLDHARDAPTALPSPAPLAAERRVAAVRPEHELVAVVGGVDDDGVVGLAQVLDLLQDGTDMLVVLEHAGAHDVFFGATLIHCHLHVLRIGMRPDVDGC